MQMEPGAEVGSDLFLRLDVVSWLYGDKKMHGVERNRFFVFSALLMDSWIMWRVCFLLAKCGQFWFWT